jgi:hypothetical protein
VNAELGTCQSRTPACTDPDQRAYRFAMRPAVFVACATHAAWLTSQGLTLIPVERRAATVAVLADRRRFVPAWLRSGRLARDLTGASR